MSLIPVFRVLSHSSLQETTDYMRPVVFTLEYGMLYPDDGPVLDDGWPTVVKSSVSDTASIENHTTKSPPKKFNTTVSY